MPVTMSSILLQTASVNMFLHASYYITHLDANSLSVKDVGRELTMKALSLNFQ